MATIKIIKHHTHVYTIREENMLLCGAPKKNNIERERLTNIESDCVWMAKNISSCAPMPGTRMNALAILLSDKRSLKIYEKKEECSGS